MHYIRLRISSENIPLLNDSKFDKNQSTQNTGSVITCTQTNAREFFTTKALNVKEHKIDHVTQKNSFHLLKEFRAKQPVWRYRFYVPQIFHTLRITNAAHKIDVVSECRFTGFFNCTWIRGPCHVWPFCSLSVRGSNTHNVLGKGWFRRVSLGVL